MFVSVRKSDFNPVSSISYEIGQKVENCRLMQECTQAELASKVRLTYQEINNYELGYSPIPIEVLYTIAEALLVNVIDLLPEPLVVRKDSYCEDEDEEILYLTGIYGRIQDHQELRKVIRPLIRSVYLSEKINQEEARIEVAKNLVKEGVCVDIISQATGLSTYEYDNIEKKVHTDSIHYKIGQRIKEWRLIREYSQKDLANKVGLTPKEIHDYERGYTAVPYDKLYEIAEALSVNVKALLPKTRKDEDSKEENKLLSLIKALLPKTTECENEDSKKLLSLINEYRETENQESQGVLDALVKSLSKGMQTSKEKVKKAEKIKVAKNLVKAGIAIDIISRASGLSAEEFS